MSDFLGIGAVSPERVARLISLAQEIKADPARFANVLAGRAVGLFFMKPSTRTRVSSEIAAVQLGAQPVVLRNEEVGLGGRESVEDVGRVLDRYLDLLAFRVFDHSDLVSIADSAAAPVVNLLSDLEHPCQAIADLVTLAEHKPGGTIAYVGDGNNVANSLMLGAAMVGSPIRLASPAGFEVPEELVSQARQYGEVIVTSDPAQAVRGADCVYTDVWTSMGQEAEAADRLASFSGFIVDEALFDQANHDAIFQHCLPAHRGEEVTHGVMEHDRSRVFDQAENRLHAFKAILVDALG